ncbi:oligosaccharide flippase family protein [Anaerovorax odorimutans]|uniref:oligosaccharide flippase family protein n=1 Tax=Anaerovorax odorimutans TaxID=109327 RepID=UPI0003FA1F55|nr:polysaccharide biosynthesis C-terminal domain-containing protein [Anaerovorax odorimutans]
MKKKLFINAIIIACTSLIFNTVGISFRVYVSNKIGSEGMGLFQLVVSVYMMTAIFVASGINIAVTRLIAEEGGRRSFHVSKILLKKAFILSLFFSIPALLFLFYGADYIGIKWLNDERTILSLKILSASMPFIGISSCIKGYFFAMSKILRPTSTQAIELIIQILVFINIFDYFISKGLEYGCAAIVIGTTLSELASCIFSALLYLFEIKRDIRYSKEYHPKGLYRKLLFISLPISVNSLIRNGLKTIEHIMIPMVFMKFGYSKKLSLENYGMIHGMTMPILVFPSFILIAFSTLLIPEVSEANALNNKIKIRYSVSRVLQLTSLISILITGIFIIFSNNLGLAIYKNAEIGIMMKALSPLIPLIYLDTVVDALLKGLNQQLITLKHNIIDSVFRIILIYYLIPLKGIVGFIIVLYLSNILNSTLSIRRLLKVTQIKLNLVDWIFKPILAILLSDFLIIFLFNKIDLSYFSQGLYVALGIILTTIIYLIFLMQFNSLSKDDIKWFKGIFKYSKEIKINSGLINKD